MHSLVSLLALQTGMVHLLQFSANLDNIPYNSRQSCLTHGTPASTSEHVISFFFERTGAQILQESELRFFEKSQQQSARHCKSSLPASAPYTWTLPLQGPCSNGRNQRSMQFASFTSSASPNKIRAAPFHTVAQSVYSWEPPLFSHFVTATGTVGVLSALRTPLVASCFSVSSFGNSTYQPSVPIVVFLQPDILSPRSFRFLRGL